MTTNQDPYLLFWQTLDGRPSIEHHYTLLEVSKRVGWLRELGRKPLVYGKLRIDECGVGQPQIPPPNESPQASGVSTEKKEGDAPCKTGHAVSQSSDAATFKPEVASALASEQQSEEASKNISAQIYKFLDSANFLQRGLTGGELDSLDSGIINILDSALASLRLEIKSLKCVEDAYNDAHELLSKLGVGETGMSVEDRIGYLKSQHEREIAEKDKCCTYWQAQYGLRVDDLRVYETQNISLRAEVIRLREALVNLVDSAHPNSKEHPIMFAAWKAATAALNANTLTKKEP